MTAPDEESKGPLPPWSPDETRTLGALMIGIGLTAAVAVPMIVDWKMPAAGVSAIALFTLAGIGLRIEAAIRDRKRR